MSKRRPPGRRVAGGPRKRPASGRPKAKAKSRPAGWRSHGPDALGLFVLFCTILMCLSLAQSAGPVGEGINWLLRGAAGSAAFVVPVGALLVALASFVRREEAGRMVVGTSLVAVSVSGAAHLLAGNPPLARGWELLASGGGIFGGLLALPLERYIGTWAGVVACAFLGALGLLIVTKTPLRRAVENAWFGLSRGGIGIAKLSVAIAAGLAATASGAVRLSARAVRANRERRERRAAAVAAEETARPQLRVVPGGDEDTGEVLDDAESSEEDEELGPLLAQTATIEIPPPPEGTEPPTVEVKIPKRGSSYKTPPSTMLRRGVVNRSVRGADEAATILDRTMSDFDVDARVVSFTRGPTVTRFEIELGPGVKVNRVMKLSDDIAYALGTPDVRLIAPIPGKSAIGVEVPNRDRELVTLGDIVHSTAWRQATHPLTCALGKDVAGHPVTISLAEMPHVLIAGATGAGKSSCLNSLICSLLMRAKPEEVRLILIDPKMVELTHFDNLPHLLAPVVTHPKRAAETLQWVVKEMERRYSELALVGQRNLDMYNAAIDAGTLPQNDQFGNPREKLPYIAVFIDELADLMMVAPRDVEDSICRITQMARAVGIHLAVATQRPSVDVVTGLIKANIPSRVAFAVASAADSRVVLDMGGADKLVGHGDMLFLPAGTSKPRRVQGAYISEKELEAITSFVRAQAEAEYADEVLEAATREEAKDDDEDTDPLLDDAMELVVRMQLGSTSMLQRRLKVGFARAGRIMDLLERRGVVGPQEGSKARTVLISAEQWAEMRARQLVE